MPKFIGGRIAGAHDMGVDNAEESAVFFRLSKAQADLLEPELVYYSLDTTDRGGPKSLAKRWHRWFAKRADVLQHPRSTPSMRKRAATWGKALRCNQHDDCKANEGLGTRCAIEAAIAEEERRALATQAPRPPPPPRSG